MPSEPGPSNRTSGRFSGTAAQLGFSPPLIAVRIKLVRSQRHWSLFVQPIDPSPVGLLADWLAPWSPLRIEFGSSRVLRADFDPLPAAWETRFKSIDLDVLQLFPNGDAVASVSGPRAALAALSRQVSIPGEPLDVQQLRDERVDARLLTKAQDEALRAAVHAGYYRVPRPLNLHDLAGRLSISSSSLSERLRRAEGRVITRYVNEGARSPWDDRTLFDAHTLGAPTGDHEIDEAHGPPRRRL